MIKEFVPCFGLLTGNSVLACDAESEAGKAVYLTFSSGIKIYTLHWRVPGAVGVSSFDHGQQYGLPAPINAIDNLSKLILGKKAIEPKIIFESGDLEIIFENNIKLQIFNFSGYEVWEVKFPNGTTQLSNYFDVV